MAICAAILAIAPGVLPGRGEDIAPNTPRADSLSSRLDNILQTKAYRHGHWGLLVVDGKSGRVLHERNADQLLAPASVTKLFSTAAALVELGPDFRFQTPIVRRGDVDARGTLQGDLILIAQGDLSMGGRTGPDGKLLFKDVDHTYASGNDRSEVVSTDPLTGLDHLAREVQGAGIRRVTGDVIVDDRLFESAPSSGSGPRRISPIMINDNVIDVIVKPGGTVGEAAAVTSLPTCGDVRVDAVVDTVDAKGKPSLTIRWIGPRCLSVRGKIPLGYRTIVGSHEVEEPASFARTLLIEALRRRGVRIEASPLAENMARGLPPTGEVARLPKVAEYISPPLRESIRVILKVSHNLHASTLPLLLAARHGERTLEAGMRRQAEVLKSLGLDPRSISFGGGAGGSRADLVSPRATVDLLRAMAARPEFPPYDAALPVLGRDGTLARAVSETSPARGHVRAKTGTYFVDNELNGHAVLTSKALAGYLETASGRQLVFAVFVNNVMLDAPGPGRTVSDATTEAGQLLGKVCEILYASDLDPSAAHRTP